MSEIKVGDDKIQETQNVLKGKLMFALGINCKHFLILQFPSLYKRYFRIKNY